MDPTRDNETILLVEDEEFLRHVVIDLLTQLGYQVLGAASSEEALTLAEEHCSGIDVLITDVLLPGLSGPELATKLQCALPNMKVIFVSGHSKDDFSLAPGATLLQKPFTIKMLSAKVREVLEAPPT